PCRRWKSAAAEESPHPFARLLRRARQIGCGRQSRKLAETSVACRRRGGARPTPESKRRPVEFPPTSAACEPTRLLPGDTAGAAGRLSSLRLPEARSAATRSDPAVRGRCVQRLQSTA